LNSLSNSTTTYFIMHFFHLSDENQISFQRDYDVTKNIFLRNYKDCHCFDPNQSKGNELLLSCNHQIRKATPHWILSIISFDFFIFRLENLFGSLQHWWVMKFHYILYSWKFKQFNNQTYIIIYLRVREDEDRIQDGYQYAGVHWCRQPWTHWISRL
jgi:hypothetical protein